MAKAIPVNYRDGAIPLAQTRRNARKVNGEPRGDAGMRASRRWWPLQTRAKCREVKVMLKLK